MRWPQLLILLAFAAVLGVPFFARRAERAQTGFVPADPRTARRLIVVTPHIEQIRVEFANAFDRWHRRVHGEPVYIDYRSPGGTTEILKLLESMYGAAAQRAFDAVRRSNGPDAAIDAAIRIDSMKPGDADFDVMFGGGSYDHTRLYRPGVEVKLDIARTQATEGRRSVTIAKPRDFPTAARLNDTVSIKAAATFDGRTLNLEIPLAAIAGGPDALRPLTAEATSVACEIDLTKCKRLITIRMSTPPTPIFSDADLIGVLGADPKDPTKPANTIGTDKVYQDDRARSKDPNDQQHWIGTALSGFGIVYNRPLHAAANITPPTTWNDLRRPAYASKLAMADPRLSGSVATLYASILDSQGFDEGFRTLRDLSGNARNFAAASTQPPMDVSQGDAIVGVAIDFYGRFQAQSVMRAGETAETARVGYIDPPGAVYVDADPVSILRGGPNPELARRFVEFCLTEEAQALWQLPAHNDPASAKNPPIAGDTTGRKLGPEQFVLRRMPVRKSLYRPELFSLFADKSNLYELASNVQPRGWRDGMIVMMGCFGIDNAQECRAAWRSLCRARTDASFPKQTLAEMEKAFYAMPEHEMADGSKLVFNEKNYAAIAADTARWRDNRRGPTSKIAYTKFFRETFQRVIELESQAAAKR